MIGLYIILLGFAAFFLWIYSGTRKEQYGEETVKYWPQAEGKIIFTDSDAHSTGWYVEFTVDGKVLQGKSIRYLRAGNRYRTGDIVPIRYELLGHSNSRFNGRVNSARVVIEDKELLSREKKSAETSYRCLLIVIGIVLFDVILILIDILQHFGVL